MKRRIAGLLVTTGLGLAALGAWLAWPREMVVLVVLDTVRADAARGPWIDELARSGTVFRNARSTSSWTAPSTASIFTSLYPPEHGVVGGFRAQQREAGVDIVLTDPTIDLRGLPADVPTLPEQLRAAGWRTVGAASNVNIGAELGFDRGFDRFRLDRSGDATTLTRQVLRWLLLAGPGRPTFVYLHLNDAHHPYRARKPWYRAPARESDIERARYDSEILAMDDALSRLAGWMSWWGEPRFVVVSDHGEAFGEHGQSGHLFSLHGEVNDVALIVHAPGRAPAVVDAPVSLIDVAPTVRDLCGLDPTGSLLGPIDPSRVLFAHRASPTRKTTLWSAVRGSYKLLHEAGSDAPAALYDLAADPGETRDVALAHPEVAAELSAALAAFQAKTGADGPTVQVELDPALIEHLTELGYVE